MDVNGFFSLACAVTAVINPGIYAHFVEERYINGMIAQDIMAIFALIILLIISLKINEKSYIKQVVGLGLLGFLFYAYGVYVIEQIYNYLYFGYMAIFSLSFFGIIYSLFRINWAVTDSAKIPAGIRRLSAVFTLLIPAVFVLLWAIIQANLIMSGEQIQNTYGVLIMDLCLIMPLFIIAAILSLREKAIGFVLTPALFVLGFTLLFPVGFSELIPGLFQKSNAPLNLSSFLLYDGLSVLFLIIGIVHMRKVQFNADEDGKI